MRQPGWSRSNRNAVRPLRGSSQVFAIRMKCCATPAPVMNHLRPRTTHLSPRALRARAHHRRIGAAARDAARSSRTSERTRPSTIGASQRCFCSGVADLREHGHVAVVGRRAVEARRARRSRRSSLRSTPPCRRPSSRVRRSSRGICGAHKPAAFTSPRTRSQDIEARCSRARRSSRDRLRAAGCARARRRDARAQRFDVGRQGEVHGRQSQARPRSAVDR